jgi:hypothetical protein
MDPSSVGKKKTTFVPKQFFGVWRAKNICPPSAPGDPNKIPKSADFFPRPQTFVHMTSEPAMIG